MARILPGCITGALGGRGTPEGVLAGVPILGGMIVGVAPLRDGLTRRIVCPGAVSVTEKQYNSGPTTTSPSGGYGHNVEWTCTFEDGSRKVVPNEQVALTGISASFGLAAVCGGAVVLPLALLGAVIGGRLVKTRSWTMVHGLLSIAYFPSFLLKAALSAGRIWNRSPTTP